MRFLRNYPNIRHSYIREPVRPRQSTKPTCHLNGLRLSQRESQFGRFLTYPIFAPISQQFTEQRKGQKAHGDSKIVDNNLNVTPIKRDMTGGKGRGKGQNNRLSEGMGVVEGDLEQMALGIEAG